MSFREPWWMGLLLWGVRCDEGGRWWLRENGLCFFDASPLTLGRPDFGRARFRALPPDLLLPNHPILTSLFSSPTHRHA